MMNFSQITAKFSAMLTGVVALAGTMALLSSSGCEQAPHPPKHGVGTTRACPNDTRFGSMVVELNDSTPKHRDNFLKLVEDQFYDSLIFHRVIREFMVQGGDPDSKGAAANARLGGGGPGYKVDAEIRPDLLHFKGALAAAVKATT